MQRRHLQNKLCAPNVIIAAGEEGRRERREGGEEGGGGRREEEEGDGGREEGREGEGGEGGCSPIFCVVSYSFKCGDVYHCPTGKSHTPSSHTSSFLHLYTSTFFIPSSLFSLLPLLPPPFSPHLDCETIRMWLNKCQDDSETANYIIANTKDVSGD